MGVPILSCPCGLRMKAKGATPGRVGRCPQCGQALKVPEAVEGPEAAPDGREVEAGPAQPGYGLNPTFRRPLGDPGDPRPARKRAKPRASEAPRAAEPEFAREVESAWKPDLLFPIRGAEGVILVVMLGLAFWGVASLMPELCLGFLADSEKIGASLMGMLVSLIAALPALMLGPLVVTYTFQYLGRVLVTGAMGESRPPRPPDRNFDGLFSGLGPWLIWLACGASVGLGPAAAYALAMGGPPGGMMAWLLAAVGLPYASMALLMTFLHDGGFPRPGVVVATLTRHLGEFLAVVAVELVLGLMVWGAFAGALALREGYYWVYLPLMLPCWMLALWSAIVAMRGLGVFYHRHASELRWHRANPWWSVSWGI